jgi:hypothetical protein
VNLAVVIVTGSILEIPDQKARIFLVLIAFTRWFFKHARKDEMHVMA